jgi:hypothetical protein
VSCRSYLPGFPGEPVGNKLLVGAYCITGRHNVITNLLVKQFEPYVCSYGIINYHFFLNYGFLGVH